MTCPKCGSSEIRESKSIGWNDIFQRVRGREAYRCRKCRQRFFASDSLESGRQKVVLSKDTHGPRKLMSTRAKKRLIRRFVAISIFAVAFYLFWLFLRYITTDRTPASDSGAVSSSLICSPS